VLVVEDHAGDRAWLVRTVPAAGYAVETAADGAAALARCEERAYDAITLDLLLPDMSGLQVLHALRESGPNRNKPVIVVSVLAEEQLVSGFAVQDVLSKPARADELLQALQRGGGSVGGRRRVLVDDDDRAALALMKALLTDLGYQPLCESEAEVALRRVAEENPAAIVLDLVMPRMDGFEFLRRLRETTEGTHLPVLVWTSKDLTADERVRLARSAQGGLPKPGSAPGAALLHELRAQLERSPRSSQHIHIGSTGQVMLVRDQGG
jgi:CheY-like chemotaxis protein